MDQAKKDAADSLGDVGIIDVDPSVGHGGGNGIIAEGMVDIYSNHLETHQYKH